MPGSLLLLYALAFLAAYLRFLGSEEFRTWWRHPPGSGFDHLHSIWRFHWIALRQVRAWLGLPPRSDRSDS